MDRFIKEGHTRIIPAKFGQNPASSIVDDTRQTSIQRSQLTMPVIQAWKIVDKNCFTQSGSVCFCSMFVHVPWESFLIIYCKGKPLRMRPLPPSPHIRGRGTVINDRDRVTEVTASVRFTLRRGRFDSSSWFTVPSVLPDVLAIHTIEMIPKSMILNLIVNF